MYKRQVIIVALIGLIATFLPWYKIVQLGTISGMSSSGWFTFIMFIIVIILALRKDLHEDLSMGISWSITICSLLASFVVLWKIIDVWFAQEGMFSLGGGMEGILGSQVLSLIHISLMGVISAVLKYAGADWYATWSGAEWLAVVMYVVIIGYFIWDSLRAKEE